MDFQHSSEKNKTTIRPTSNGREGRDAGVAEYDEEELRVFKELQDRIPGSEFADGAEIVTDEIGVKTVLDGLRHRREVMRLLPEEYRFRAPEVEGTPTPWRQEEVPPTSAVG